MRFFTIKWRPVTSILFTLGILAIVATSFVSAIAPNFEKKVDVKIGIQNYRLLLANDEASRVKGLSDVAALRPDGGLIMAFDKPDLHSIWMKDMLVALDILWLDENGSVVYIIRDAGPELGTSKIFTPVKPAKYVVEIAAGQAKQQGVRVGSVLEFDKNEVAPR